VDERLDFTRVKHTPECVYGILGKD